MEWIIAQLSTPLPALEGTGDSETNNESSDDRSFGCIQEGAIHDELVVVVDDDDDAESCSHDSYGRAQIESGSDDDDDDDGAHGVDEEGVFVWLQRMKSDEEEEEKVVDLEDDDKLFWETCLASGYP